MQIELACHHIDATPALRRHVEEKAAHLRRIFDGISTFHVSLHVEKSEVVAEFVANVSHGPPVVAKAAGKTAHAAVDVASDKVEVQLRRHKEKIRDHRGRDHAEQPESSPGPVEEENDRWETSATSE